MLVLASVDSFIIQFETFCVLGMSVFQLKPEHLHTYVMRLYLIITFCFNWLSPIQHWQGEVRGTASLLPGGRSVGLTLGIIDT